MISQTWGVLGIQFYKNGRRMGDGDTLNVVRRGVQRLGDKDWILEDPTHTGIRLVWVDTPEKDEPGWAKATADLTKFILPYAKLDGSYNMHLVTYGSAGWDRILGDLIGDDGRSASQYLMTECDWPMYKEGS